MDQKLFIDENLIICALKNEHIDEVANLVTDVFVHFEPMTAFLCIKEKTFHDYFLLPWLVNSKMELSLVAIQNKKIVAALLNEEIILPVIQHNDQINVPGMEPIFELLGEMEDKWFATIEGQSYGCYSNEQSECRIQCKVFHMFMVAVDEKYRMNGLAHQLLTQSIKYAEENGYNYIIAEATGIASQKAFYRLGFQCLESYNYETWTDNNNQQPFQKLINIKISGIVIPLLKS